MITAKIKCTSKEVAYNDQYRVRFQPDYADGRNKAWAEATPTLMLDMTVKGGVAGLFEPGDAYTLTFTPTEDDQSSSTPD